MNADLHFIPDPTLNKINKTNQLNNYVWSAPPCDLLISPFPPPRAYHLGMEYVQIRWEVREERETDTAATNRIGCATKAKVSAYLRVSTWAINCPSILRKKKAWIRADWARLVHVSDSADDFIRSHDLQRDPTTTLTENDSAYALDRFLHVGS
jgi:hypothetical protein